MPNPELRRDLERGATSAQLRQDIDSGLTGDKIAGFDPAAVPLGVDEEAGGTAPDPHLIDATRVIERTGRPATPRANAATPDLAPDARTDRRPSFLVAILIGVAGATVFGLVLQAFL